MFNANQNELYINKEQDYYLAVNDAHDVYPDFLGQRTKPAELVNWN